MLADGERFEDASPAVRDHLLAETALRAFADRGRWLQDDGMTAEPPANLVTPARASALMASYSEARHTPAGELSPRPVERLENPGATSFIVVDRDSSAVACTLTLYNLFGTGRLAGGTGILLAALPGPAGRGPTSLGPMMVLNEHVNELIFAGAASGGAAAPTSLITVAARAVLGEQSLTQAIEAKRVHHQGVPDTTFIESGFSEEARAELGRRGHQVAVSPSLGQVNAAYCPKGLPSHPDLCTIATDPPPRGYGLTAIGGE
jgi:gamma-glutamyltranspeptidase/glutathione hydrolase